MTKTKIAKTIIDICQNDASFCKDIKGGDTNLFLSEINDAMSEKNFLFAVEKYLATFKVWGHLYFYKKDWCPYIGFRVRRYKNSLYITHAEKDLPFFKGDEIVAIDGLTIEKAAQKFAVFFEGDEFDRQGERWENVIANSDVVTVRAERTFDYPIRADINRGTREQSCEYKFLNKDCYYIKLTDFFDDQNISDIIKYGSTDITAAQNLIIDLRNNCGGNDTVFLPLLKFFLNKDDIMCGKPIFTGIDDILYSERNVEGRLKFYKEFLERTTTKEIRKYIIGQIDEQIRNKGKGFVPAKADEFLFPICGTLKPQKVIILIDYYCGSSAESLVEIASKLSKVTTLGRPTMGICDYSNLTWFDFGDYVLHYPTSRSKAIDEGKGTRGLGLKPDILIPWTPKHIHEDVDLDTALEFLSK